MVVQDRQFNPDGSLLYPVAPTSTNGPWIGEHFGDLMLVNGKIWPSTPLRRRQSIHRDADVEQRRGLGTSSTPPGHHPMHTHLFRFKVMAATTSTSKASSPPTANPTASRNWTIADVRLGSDPRWSPPQQFRRSRPRRRSPQASTLTPSKSSPASVQSQSRRTPAYAPQSN